MVEEIEYRKSFAQEFSEQRLGIVNNHDTDTAGPELFPHERESSLGTNKMVNDMDKADKVEEIIFKKAVLIEVCSNVCGGKTFDGLGLCNCDGFEAIELFIAVISGDFEQSDPRHSQRRESVVDREHREQQAGSTRPLSA